MPADPKRVKQLFVKALEFEGDAERVAFLEDECEKSDPELRRRLDQLLEAHDHPESALDRPLGALASTIDDSSSTEFPGTVIADRYKLLEQVGEGGMGEVWVADQLEPIKRRVALKLIKPGMDSRAVLARFEAERQALALMDHPNIAKVLDAGTADDGRPYFVMELVKGTPITEFCDARLLSTRERLELFIPVCMAIQHAHQKGIIHRDVKPSNVLVAMHDEKAVPKVIDFGVAKAIGQQLTEKTLYTGYGTLVGTPAYMAPEQATFNQLDVDTRADVYALGVILYELLAGSPPFDPDRLKKAALDEVLRLVREEEPPRPSHRLSTSQSKATIAAVRHTEPARLAKQLRGDLDWIVMKALEKDRTRRYETASGLAKDVERYLNGEPVLAVPPSAGYRIRKFARRNRAGLVGSGLVLAVVTVLGGGAGWVIRDRAVRHADTERRIDDLFQVATNLREQKKWTDARASARQAELLLVASGKHTEFRSRLDSLIAELDMVERIEAVRLNQTAVKENTWDHAGAVAGYKNAFNDYGIDIANLVVDAAVDRVRTSPIREELVAALDDWRTLLPASQKTLSDQIRGVVTRADPDAWRNRFRETSKQDRRSLEDLATLPEVGTLPPASVVLLGRALRGAGSPQRAVDVLAAAQRRFPADVWLNLELAKTLRWNFQPARFDEAAGYMRAAVAIRPNSAGIYSGLGSSLHTRAHIDEAIAAYRRAIEIEPDFADAHQALGRALATKGLWDEAIKSYLATIRLRPKSARIQCELAWAYRWTHVTEKAIAAYEEAVRLNPAYELARHELAWAFANCPEPHLRDPKRAVELADNLLRLKPNDVEHLMAKGVAMFRCGDWDGALVHLNRAHEGTMEGNAYVWFFLAMAHARKGNTEQAIRWFDAAVRWTESRLVWVTSIPIVYEDLARFRSEASDLLGIAMPPSKWPPVLKTCDN